MSNPCFPSGTVVKRSGRSKFAAKEIWPGRSALRRNTMTSSGALTNISRWNPMPPRVNRIRVIASFRFNSRRYLVTVACVSPA